MERSKYKNQLMFEKTKDLVVERECINPIFGYSLDDFINGHLSKEEAEEFNEHLMECSFCENEFWEELNLRSCIHQREATGEENHSFAVG